MKKNRIYVTTLVMFLALLSFTGCKYQKQQAFKDYAEEIQSDVVYWEAAATTLGQIDYGESNSKVYISYMGTAIDYIDKIITNAETRNSQISEPELKSIDDYYVQYAKDLRMSYALMQEAINENDQAKFDKGAKYGESALENFKIYVTGIKEYMEAYGIQANSGMTEIFNQFQAGE